MVDIPDVRYAQAGSVAIAFQVVGDGPRTLLYSPSLSDLYSIWAAPSSRPFFERLAAELRLIVFNPRGTGFSDKPRDLSLEARMDDILAVLNTLDIDRVSLLGNWLGANTCALFAASYPERCEHLVLQQLSRAEPRRPTTRMGGPKSGGSSGFANFGSIMVKERFSRSGRARSIPR